VKVSVARSEATGPPVSVFFLSTRNLSVLLSSELGSSISDLHRKLLGALDNLPPDPGADRVCDGSSVSAVVHHEHLELGNIGDNDGLEAAWVDVAGLLVRAVSDGGHGKGALEATAHAAIDTLRLAP